MQPLAVSPQQVTDVQTVKAFKSALQSQVSAVANLYAPIVEATAENNQQQHATYSPKNPPGIGEKLNVSG